MNSRRLIVASATAALGACAAIAFALRTDDAAAPAAAPPAAEVAAPESAPSPVTVNLLEHPELARPPEIPADQAPIVAQTTGKVVYTHNYLGEPMEVYPDGKVIIRDHKTKAIYKGKEIEVLQTLTGRPHRFSQAELKKAGSAALTDK